MKTILRALTITALASVIPLAAAQVASFHASGDALDATSNHHDGTLGTDVTYGAGRTGQGFSFPGTDNTAGKNVVTIPESPNPPESSHFKPTNLTVSAWVKFADQTSSVLGGCPAGQQFIVAKQNTRTFAQGYALDYALLKLADGRLWFGADFGPNDEVAAISTTKVVAGRWYYVVATYDHTAFKIYVNGKLEGQTTETRNLDHAATPVYLGRTNASEFDGLFKGVMDEVQFFDAALTPAQIPALDPANAGTGLVSWWPGNGNANDVQGSNSGTLQNGATFATGEVGQAFSLDGTDDYVSTTASPDWNLGANDFTIDGWINVATPSSYMRLISAGSTTGASNHLWTLGYGSGWGGGDRLNFYYWNGSSYADVTSNVVTIGTNAWHHIAVSRTGSTLTFYFDGSPVGTGSIGTVGTGDSNTQVILGARYPNNSSSLFEFASGLLDEVDVFKRGLSASEVQAIYTAGATGKSTAPALSLADAFCVPGSSGTTNLVFTVNVARPNASAITVDYATLNGSAIAGTDYTSTTNSLTIPANTSSATITVPVTGNASTFVRLFYVTLSNATNASINRAHAEGTIFTGNVQADFITETNTPTQLWQYGATDASGTGFTNLLQRNVYTTDIAWHMPGNAYDLGLVFNVLGTVDSYNIGTHQPADELGMFPGNDGRKVVLRWRAPTTGQFHFEGLFEGIESAGGATTSDATIVVNASTVNPQSVLFNAGDSSDVNYVNGYGTQKTFSFDRNLPEGATVDFRVGWGNNNQYSYDGTGLKVTVSAVLPSLQAISTDANTKTGPATPGANIHFAISTDVGVTVKLQATTTPDTEQSWADVSGGTLIESATTAGSYTLDTTSYPKADGVYFRFVSSAPGYTDGKSDNQALGPYDLRLSQPAISPVTFELPKLPGLPMRFTAQAVAGAALKLQSTTNGTTWTDVSGATATETSTGKYEVTTTNYPTTNNVSFRFIATKSGLLDGTSNVMGPCNLTPPNSTKTQDLLGYVTIASDPYGTTDSKGVRTYTAHTDDTVQMELVYFNNSATPITGANVQVVVPASFMTVTATTPTTSILTSGTNKIVKWNFDIPANTKGTLFLSGTVVSATPSASWTPVATLYKGTSKLVAVTMPKITVTEPLQFTLEASSDTNPTGATVHTGEAIQYIVSVRNPTSQTVSNVKMGMAFPTGTRYITASMPPAGVTFLPRGTSGKETGIDWTVATLPGSGFVSVFVLVEVTAADSASSGIPSIITQSTATCTHGSFKITAPAFKTSVVSSLEVILTSDLNIARPGDVIHYTLDVHNYGTVPLINAKLVTLLPQGMRLSAANTDDGNGNFINSAFNGDQVTGTTNPAVDRSGGPTLSTLTWKWNSFPAKAGKTVRFACQAMYDDPLEYILNGAHITNQVSIYEYNFIGNLATNTAKRLYAAKPASTSSSATPLQLLSTAVTRVSANLSGEPNVPPNLSLKKTALGDGTTQVGNDTIATVINDPATPTDGIYTYELKVVNGKVHDPAFPNDPTKLIAAGTASNVQVHDFLPSGTAFLGFLALNGTNVPSYTNFHFYDASNKEIDATIPANVPKVRSFTCPLYDMAGGVTHKYTYKVQTTLAAGNTISSNSGGYSGKYGLYTFDPVTGYHLTASNLNFPVNGGPDQLLSQVVLPAKFDLPAGVLFSRAQLVGSEIVSVAVPVNVLGGTSLSVSGVKIEVPIAKGYVASNAQLLDSTGTALPITITPGAPDGYGTRKLTFPMDTRRGATAVFQVAVDQANINTLLDSTHHYFKAPLSIKPTISGTFTKTGGGTQAITPLSGLGVLPVLGSVTATVAQGHSAKAKATVTATPTATGDSQVFVGRCAPAAVRRGETLTYTIFVGNLTQEVLRNATITMNVPDGTTFKSASNYIFNFMVTAPDGSDTGGDSGNAISKDPFKATVSGKVVKWDLAALLQAEAGVVTLTVNVPSTFSGSRIDDNSCAFDALNTSGKNAGSQSVVVLSGNQTAQSASTLQGVIEGLGADFNDDVRAQLNANGFSVGKQSCVTSIGGTDLVHLSNGVVVIPLPGNRTFCFGPSTLISASGIRLLNDDGMMRIAVGPGSETGTAAIGLNLSGMPNLAGALAITPNSVLTGFVTNNLVSTNGGNVVAAGAGNVVAQGAGNVVAAGAGNVVAAGAGNFSGTSLGGLGGAQLKLPDNMSPASLSSTLGGHVVAQGAGNVVAAGAGNVVAAGAGNVVAAGAGNALAPNAGVVAAGAGNVVAQGAGNVVAQGAGNVIAQGGGNLVSTNGGNVIAQGGGNFAPANFK